VSLIDCRDSVLSVLMTQSSTASNALSPAPTLRARRALWLHLLVILQSLFFVSPLCGQDQVTNVTAPIITDRPSFTNSSIVVPSGSFQAENGLLVTGNQGQNILDGPETLLRAGVASRTEFRFTVPNYFYNLTTGGGPGSGFGDLAIGVKQQLGPVAKFDVSATLLLSVPTGAPTVSSGGYDPTAQLAWSRGLTSKWTLAGMFSFFAPTQGSQRNSTGESTILLNRQLARNWDAFVEYVGDFPEHGGSRQLMHFGTTLKVTSNQQLDFHVGFGVTSAAPSHFVGFGYSFRFFTR